MLFFVYDVCLVVVELVCCCACVVYVFLLLFVCLFMCLFVVGVCLFFVFACSCSVLCVLVVTCFGLLVLL